jgi:Arc/MetJ-type ribon-helix-helix transcriptional regulator
MFRVIEDESWRSSSLPQKKKSSTKLKDELVEELAREKSRKRESPVMTRLSADLIEMLDILVKLDIFKSKSEAVASIVAKTLYELKDNFHELKAEITKIEKIQDSAKDVIADALQVKQ